MKRSDAITAIQKLEPELRNLGVRTISLFGSVRNDTASPTSDLDLVQA